MCALCLVLLSWKVDDSFRGFPSHPSSGRRGMKASVAPTAGLSALRSAL